MIATAYLFTNEVRCRIMQECFQDCHECIFVLAQYVEADFTCFTKWPYQLGQSTSYIRLVTCVTLGRGLLHTIISVSTKRIHHIWSKTKWNQLRFIERQTLQETAVRSTSREPSLSCTTYLVEKAIEVNVQHTTSAFFEEDVFSMPIP